MKMQKGILNIVLSATVSAAAILSTHSCVMCRFIAHGTEGTDDYKVFYQDTIYRSQEPFLFKNPPQETHSLDTVSFIFNFKDTTLAMSLKQIMDTVKNDGSMLIIHNDTIIFEAFSGNFDRTSICNVFSISKTLTSLLCGIAIDEGYIKSVNDPVTEYLPELADKDPMYCKLTIEHLLDMRTGLKFKENYSANPFSGMARLYYGRNQMRQIRNVSFKSEPGSEHYYNSMATAILGTVIERATGKSYAEYMTEKVWRPLGMEHDALVSLDDRHHRAAKAYAGIAATAIDLAKIGRLYLNKGDWNGTRIVDSAWVERSLTTNWDNECYSYSWRSLISILDDPETGDNAMFPDSLSAARYLDSLGLDKNSFTIFNETETFPDGDTWCIESGTGGFFALGIFGQTIYVNPDRNLIGVWIGSNRLFDYYKGFDLIADILAPDPTSEGSHDGRL